MSGRLREHVISRRGKETRHERLTFIQYNAYNSSVEISKDLEANCLGICCQTPLACYNENLIEIDKMES